MYLAIAVASTAVLLAPRPVRAQERDSEWKSDCENSYQGRYGSRREPYCEVRVSGFKARGGTITVDPGDNGGVEIRGWDKDSIEVHARIQAYDRSEGDAKDIAGRVKVTTRGNDIGADGPDVDRGQSWSVSFFVYVPRKTDISLDTQNGPIDVREVSGALHLTTANGPIYLSQVAGDVRARSQNGPVSVRLDGVKWDGAGLDASSQNGPVELRVPRDYNANLEVGTTNGPMTVGFPVEVTMQGHLTRRISTKLGTGGATIRAVTQNGPFTLSRTGTER
jgi:DUF4097 and DUF4098 domain-containing protein YvlB